MPFTPPPQIPNFNFPVGRIATDRYDFEAHLEGVNPPLANAPKQNFRHNATQIDLSPAVTIGGNPFTTVQSAITILGTLVVPTPPPPATTTTLGVVKLAGDITGIDGNSVTVSGLRNRPIANLVPVTGNILVFNAGIWSPSNTINGNLTINGIITTTGTFTASGGITLPNGQAFNANSGSLTTFNGPAVFGSGANLTISTGSDIIMQTGTLLQINSGGGVGVSGFFDIASGGNITVQSGGVITVQSGGNITSNSGSLVSINGEIDIGGFIGGPSLVISSTIKLSQQPISIGNGSTSISAVNTPLLVFSGTLINPNTLQFNGAIGTFIADFTGVTNIGAFTIALNNGSQTITDITSLLAAPKRIIIIVCRTANTISVG
jgi:hypothetical protein